MATVTLRQVAELADVSIGTASQALNNHPGVAPETRVRVMDAASSLGYRLRHPTPQPEERTAALSVIGMLTKHDAGLPVAVNSFYFHIQAGIEQACREQQISLMYANVEVDTSNRPLSWPAMVNNRQINGLILAGTFLDGAVDGLQQQLGVPIVLVDSYAAGSAFDSIVTDNVGGATAAVQHLLALGHRHIGLVGANPASPPSIRERREGYVRALGAVGATAYIEESALSQEGGYLATLALLRRAPEVTAIFACNDLTALGVCDAAYESGRQVPQDLSVVGFDDIDTARNHRPPLTTMHVHKSWMGVLSVRKLLERHHDPHAPTTTTTLSTRLMVRKSSCPPRELLVVGRGT
ncbi:MAG: LacI family transcriptional regulator [Chloroflexaceae bacterium]|jgi:LacI family transcriptional regulator|nr:LacI family transcriptional regulator [Chloroflexaceae bacterium]